MTDEERTALRDEIEGLTIKQAKARGEVATETLSILRGLGLMGPNLRPDYSMHTLTLPSGAPVVQADPYPCPRCGRTGPEKPNEPTQPAECLECGNHLPLERGVIMSSKGAVVLPSMDPAERARRDAERMAMLSAPAFDANGEPIA